MTKLEYKAKTLNASIMINKKLILMVSGNKQLFNIYDR